MSDKETWSPQQQLLLSYVASAVSRAATVQATHQGALLEVAKALSIIGKTLPEGERSAELGQAITSLLEELRGASDGLKDLLERIERANSRL